MVMQAKLHFGALVFGTFLAAAPTYGASTSIVTGPAIQVVVSLSAAAAARLANPQETIVIDGDYYGVPKSPKQRAALQGRLSLSPEQKIEIPGAGAAKFAGPKYDRSKLSLVEDGALRVAIEVYSGRHSSPDNLLDCGFIDDTVQHAAASPVQIHCNLIGEKQ